MGPGRKRFKKEKKKWIVLAVLAAAMVFAAVPQILCTAFPVNKGIASIDGETIEKEELRLFLSDEKSDTLLYFQKTYGAEYTEDFWTKEFDGEIPIRTAVDNALKELTKVKTEQILFVENGLAEDISYTRFKKELQQVNERRAEGKKIIYGPAQYSEEVYYQYLNTSREEELKEKLQDEDEFQANEEELKILYCEYQKSLLKSVGRTVAERITIPYTEDKEHTRELAEGVAEAIRQGMDTEEAAGQLGSEYIVSRMELDENSIRNEEFKYNKKLVDAAIALKNSGISDPVDTGSSYEILRCIEKEEPEYFSFEESRKMLQQIYFEKKFEEILEKKADEADIKRADDIYEIMCMYL